MKKLRNNFFMKKLIYIILFSISFSFTYDKTLNELIKEYIKKSANHVTSSELIKKILKYPGEDVLNELLPYVNDSSVNIRLSAIFMVYKVGMYNENNITKEKAVNILIEKLKDKDAGVIGRVIDYISSFSLECFTSEMKYNIYLIVQNKIPHYDKLIKLAGYLQITDLVYYFKKMATEDKYSRKEKWAMTLAMARMGDEEAIKNIKSKIENLPINDDVIEEIYDDFLYVRQKEVFDVILDIIMSDKKNCLSSNPDNEIPVLCAFKLIKMIAPYIKDFPLKKDEAGEYIIRDYESTLKEIRTWIDDNIDTYELIKNIY